MKIYSAHGINEFIICCGYKGYLIKEYFANYFLHMSDVTFDMANNHMEVHQRHAEPWRVTLVDTGENTGTGGRLKRVASYLKNEQAFCFTYGDGVGDIDISALIHFHQTQKRKATLTATHLPGRFGALDLSGDQVKTFHEKPQNEGAMVNGGFFVLSPDIFDYITDDQIFWEGAPLEQLAQENELAAFQHHGFWQAMDTLRDKNTLEALWQSGQAPWKVWD